MNGSSQHQSFLRAILDSPDDDLPRLVYADFLEETGDSDRAEFIRIQCEMAAGSDSPEREKALERRQNELLTEHLEGWRLPIRGHQTFRRGFVDSLWTSANFLLKSEPELISDSTVRTLRITNADQRIDDLAEYRGFANIEHLDLTNNNLSGDYRLRAILGNPDLARLKGLNLHNNRIWADDVLRLAQAPVARQLTHLDLSGNGIGNEGVSHLVDEEAFANLVVLNLRSDGLPEYECISRSTLPKLVYRSKRLKSLDLAGHHIGDEGDFGALMLATLRSTIAHFDVSANHVGGNELRVPLRNASGTIALRSFNYSRNRVSPDDATGILEWQHLPNMVEFRFTDCDMDDDTRTMLLASPHASKFHLDGESR